MPSKIYPSHAESRNAASLGKRLALLPVDFETDFPLQVVMNILGFLITMRQAEVIQQGAIHPEREFAGVADFPFRHERPIPLPRAVSEQIPECGPDRGLVAHAKIFKLTQCGVITLDGLVGRSEFQRLHHRFSQLDGGVCEVGAVGGRLASYSAPVSF